MFLLCYLFVVFVLVLCVLLFVYVIEFSVQELVCVKVLQQCLVIFDSYFDMLVNFGCSGFDIEQCYDCNVFLQVDYLCMVEGVLDGGFWVIYIDQGDCSVVVYLVECDYGLQWLLEICEMLVVNFECFVLVLIVDDVVWIKVVGKCVVYISMENVSLLVVDFSLFLFYYCVGLCLFSIVYFVNNEFVDLVIDFKGVEWKGLSLVGKDLVWQVVKLGIVIDQLYVLDVVFDDLLVMMLVLFVLLYSLVKVVYDYLCNFDDVWLCRLVKVGGVIQVNVYGGYLIDIVKMLECKQVEEVLSKQLGGWEGMGIEQGVVLLKVEQVLDYEYLVCYVSLDDFFVYFEYIFMVVGFEYVGIGLDWDGGGGLSDLFDVSQLLKIIVWLLCKGYIEKQIVGIWGGNLLWVMCQVQDQL